MLIKCLGSILMYKLQILQLFTIYTVYQKIMIKISLFEIILPGDNI